MYYLPLDTPTTMRRYCYYPCIACEETVWASFLFCASELDTFLYYHTSQCLNSIPVKCLYWSQEEVVFRRAAGHFELFKVTEKMVSSP